MSLEVRLRERIRKEAEKLGGYAIAVGNADDHVHAVVTLPPTLAVATLMQQIKGGTSHAWNRTPHSSLERHPLAWQDGYWAESCNVEQQREVHDDASLFEMLLEMKKPGEAGT